MTVLLVSSAAATLAGVLAARGMWWAWWLGVLPLAGWLMLRSSPMAGGVLAVATVVAADLDRRLWRPASAPRELEFSGQLGRIGLALAAVVIGLAASARALDYARAGPAQVFLLTSIGTAALLAAVTSPTVATRRRAQGMVLAIAIVAWLLPSPTDRVGEALVAAVGIPLLVLLPRR
jgi:FtsH-binding integral membrane protein